MDRNLVVLFWNADSMSVEKAKKLKSELDKCKADVFAIMEAGKFCNQENDVKKYFPDYQLKFLPMYRQKSSGIVLGVKIGLSFEFSIIKTMKEGDEKDGLEAVRCDVRKDGEVFTLVALYNPPSSETDLKVLKPAEGMIIFGDFNTHSERWGYARTLKSGKRLEVFIDGNSLVYVPSDIPGEKTFKSTKGSETTPDLVLAHRSIRERVSQKAIGYLTERDHKAIQITIKIEAKEAESTQSESSEQNPSVDSEVTRDAWITYLNNRLKSEKPIIVENDKLTARLDTLERKLKRNIKWNYANETRSKAHLEHASYLVQNLQDGFHRKTPVVVIFIKVNLMKVFTEGKISVTSRVLNAIEVEEIELVVEALRESFSAKKILFNEIVNEFCDYLRGKGIKFILTTNDFAIFANNSDFKTLENNMNEALEKFVSWISKCGLNKNAFLAHYQIFTKRKIPEDFKLSNKEIQFPRQELTEYLEVSIDSKLKFETHAEKCNEKALNLLDILADFLNKQKINLNEFKIFLKEIVIQHLMSGQELLICSKDYVKAKSSKFQAKFLKLIAKKYRNSIEFDDTIGDLRSKMAINLYEGFRQAGDSLWKNYKVEPTRLKKKSFLVIVQELERNLSL